MNSAQLRPVAQAPSAPSRTAPLVDPLLAAAGDLADRRPRAVVRGPSASADRVREMGASGTTLRPTLGRRLGLEPQPRKKVAYQLMGVAEAKPHIARARRQLERVHRSQHGIQQTPRKP